MMAGAELAVMPAFSPLYGSHASNILICRYCLVAHDVCMYLRIAKSVGSAAPVAQTLETHRFPKRLSHASVFLPSRRSRSRTKHTWLLRHSLSKQLTTLRHTGLSREQVRVVSLLRGRLLRVHGLLGGLLVHGLLGVHGLLCHHGRRRRGCRALPRRGRAW
jgi:hypothetical protein